MLNFEFKKNIFDLFSAIQELSFDILKSKFVCRSFKFFDPIRGYKKKKST